MRKASITDEPSEPSVRNASRRIEPFSYMAWAKAHSAPIRFHLGQSGLAPPGDAEGFALSEGAPVDLVQRGPDMPPDARSLLAARYGISESRLMVTLGTSQALYLLCASELEPEDGVLVERPDYELLHKLPALHRARVSRFERTMADGFRLPADLPERIKAERPRLILLTNPHNPSGALLSLRELEPVARAAESVGARLVVDEVYLEFLRDAPAASALSLGPSVVVAASFTKAFGLGTVRFGWLIAAERVIDAAIAYNDYVSVLYPNPSAQIGTAAMAELPRLARRAEAIRARGLPILASWIASRNDVRWHEPEAGVMALVGLDRLEDTRAFCERLAREDEVVVVPGEFFGAPGCVRIGFGVDEATLREGLARLGTRLDTL